MPELADELEKWAVRGKLLQPYEVKPLLRRAATRLRELEKLASDNV